MGEKKEKKEKKEKRERDVQEEGGGKKAKVENEIEIENAAAADDDDYAPSMKFKAADGRDKGTSETVHPAPGTFPTSGTKVYMGNLAWSIDEAAVAEAFADCGEVLSIKWFEEKETKKFLGAGVVEFDSSEAAQRAVAAPHFRHQGVHGQPSLEHRRSCCGRGVCGLRRGAEHQVVRRERDEEIFRRRGGGV